jgi:hypothetical protein
VELGHPFRTVTPSLDGEILAVLVRTTDEVTAPRIHSLIGEFSESGVRKACARLSAQGIVLQRRVGHADVYLLNREHVAADAVIAIAELRDTFVDRLSAHLSAWEQPCAYAALFGAATRRSMGGRADVDVFIVRPDVVDESDPGWRRQVDTLRTRIKDWTGNGTRVLEYRERQMQDGLRLSGNPIALTQPRSWSERA